MTRHRFAANARRPTSMTIGPHSDDADHDYPFRILDRPNCLIREAVLIFGSDV